MSDNNSRLRLLRITYKLHDGDKAPQGGINKQGTRLEKSVTTSRVRHFRNLHTDGDNIQHVIHTNTTGQEKNIVEQWQQLFFSELTSCKEYYEYTT